MSARKGRHLERTREERFRNLYEEHREAVARYVARRATADDVQDVLAETFLTAWRRFDSIPSDSLPWLFVTARNVLANRRRSNERRVALDAKLSSASVKGSDSDTPDGSGIDRRLLAAIEALPDAEREAFMLVAWDGLDPARAARAASCNPGTFRMRLHRARRRLQEEMSARHPFAPLPELQTSLEESR